MIFINKCFENEKNDYKSRAVKSNQRGGEYNVQRTIVKRPKCGTNCAGKAPWTGGNN